MSVFSNVFRNYLGGTELSSGGTVTPLPLVEALNPTSTVMGGITGEILAQKLLAARDSSGFMPLSLYPASPTNAQMIAFAAANNKTFCDIYWNNSNDSTIPFVKAVRIKDNGTLDFEYAAPGALPVITLADLDPLSSNYTLQRAITPQAFKTLNAEPFVYDESPIELDEDYTRFLTGYDINLPVDAAGRFSGISVSVKGSSKFKELLTYNSSLVSRDTATIASQLRKTIIMTAPNVGATTSGATHPRTELLGRQGPLTSGRFSHTQDFMQRMKLRVVQKPVGAQVAVSQLHSNTDPWVIITVDQDPMILKAALRRTEGGSGTSYTIKPSLALNEWVEVIISHTGGASNHFVEIYINGALAATDSTTPFTQTNPCFMKAGAYYVGSEGVADASKNVVIEFVVDEPAPNRTGVFAYRYEAGKAEPSVINTLVASTITASTVALTWTLPAANGSALTGGVVQRSLDGEIWTQVGTLLATDITFINLGLVDVTTYYYRIAFSNLKGQADYSNVVRVNTKALIGAATPTPFSVTLPVGTPVSRYVVTIPATGVLSTDSIIVSMAKTELESVGINTILAFAGVNEFSLTLSFQALTTGILNFSWRKV